MLSYGHRVQALYKKTDHKGQRAQGHSRTIQIRKTSVTPYDTMMSHFVRGRYNAIDWLEFRISYLR